MSRTGLPDGPKLEGTDMARKRGEYQKRKERHDKVKSIIVILFFFASTVLFLYGLVQAGVNVYDIDHNTLNTYTGKYTYQLKVGYGRHRNSTYIFALDNGNVVLVSKRKMDHEELLDENNALTFQYSTMYSNLLYGRYSAVSITSADGDVEFVSAVRSRKESVMTVWLLSIFSVFTLAFGIFFVVVTAYVYHWKKRYQNWRKRMQKKSQAKLPQE